MLRAVIGLAFGLGIVMTACNGIDPMLTESDAEPFLVAQQEAVWAKIKDYDWHDGGDYTLLRMSGELHARQDAAIFGITVRVKRVSFGNPVDAVDAVSESNESKRFPKALKEGESGIFYYQGWFRLANSESFDIQPVITVQYR